MSSIYQNHFFHDLDDSSRSSARVVCSILHNLFPIKSLIDIGCGAASWIRISQEIFEMDSENLVGVDGKYSRPFHEGLPNRFIYTDLRDKLDYKFDIKFDLAVSIEVAEHLPAGRASSFVDDLCGLSNIVLFSAAIPGQGGTGHINEQWPKFWMNEFERNNYSMFDCIRPFVWENPRVCSWYAQNIFVFVQNEEFDITKKLEPWRLRKDDWRLQIVHPGIFRLAACDSAGVSRLIKAFPGRLIASVQNRLKKINFFGA